MFAFCYRFMFHSSFVSDLMVLYFLLITGMVGLSHVPFVGIVSEGSTLVTFGFTQKRVILLIYHRFSERPVRGSSCTLINCLFLSPILYLFPMMFMLGESFSTGHDNCLYITSMAIYPYDAILKCKCFLGITL